MALLAAVVSISAAVWVVQLVRVAASVGEHRTYWSKPQSAPGGLVYVALGDSTAQGIGASSPERGYVGLLAERLRQETGQPVQVVNLSQSGGTVRDVVDTQLPQLAGPDPDLVTVTVGANDIDSYDSARFSTDVDDLTAALPSGTLIADVPYFMHGRWQRDAEEATELLTASAQAEQLTVVPLSRTQRDRGSRAMLTDFAADWFHPNDRGYRVWAEAFWNEMAEP